MGCLVQWCNTNNGFLSAILSAAGLLLSIIAIAVSIHTARLPFKKKIKLSSSVNISFCKNELTGESYGEIAGVSVNAANVGFRNVNIVYLGIKVKDRSFPNGQQHMMKIRDEHTGIGIIAPAEVKVELYKKADLLFALSKISPKAKIYLYARDSEGKDYLKYSGNAAILITQLSADKV